MKNFKKEKTLIIIKPDGIQRSLIGEIIKRYERSGLKLIALKMLVPDKNLTQKHYLIDPQWKQKTGQNTINAYRSHNETPPFSDPTKMGNFILDKLVKYFTCSPVIVMAWQGMHAVEIVRKITGGTEPKSSDMGTIRGDFTIDSYAIADTDKRAVRNLVHASGSPEEAEAEIKLWFKPTEILNYRLLNEEILYDVNLDGILE